MKKLITNFVVGAVLLCFISCSKEKIVQKEEDTALGIMTDGSWIITKFTEAGTNITSTFAGYECRFNTDKTCVASKGTESVAGTWTVSISSRTITSWFPESEPTLTRINGTWSIVKNNAAFGEFSQTKNGIFYDMELTKK